MAYSWCKMYVNMHNVRMQPRYIFVNICMNIKIIN